MIALASPRWEEIPLRTVAELDDEGAPVLVVGEVVLPPASAPPLALPEDVPLPTGVAPRERLVVAAIAVEEMPPLARPIRALHEQVRDFALRGPAGTSALVRFPDERRDVLELRLGQPFLHATDGRRDVYLRSVAVGDRVVVGGRLRFPGAGLGPPGSWDPAGRGHAYRAAPRRAVVDAEILFDGAAWDELQAWQALPWHRKLSLILRNR